MLPAKINKINKMVNNPAAKIKRCVLFMSDAVLPYKNSL
jgi:hypothetical protein